MKKGSILKSGDKVGIAAPSALFKTSSLNASLRALKKMGLVPVLASNIKSKDFIYSGTPQERADGFLELAHRDDIKAIWCMRGGYGCWTVAAAIGESPAPKVPKTLIGLSDVTSLHLACQKFWGWTGVHGALFSRLGNLKPTSLEYKTLKATLFDSDFRLVVDKKLKKLGSIDDVSAPLVGGNLAILLSSLRTPWEINTKGKILFIEDVGERAYRVDRMLYQLKLAGKLDDLKGVIIGDFTDCHEPNGKDLWPEVIRRHFKDAGYPVITGLHSGHGNLCLPLPLGVECRISTRRNPVFEVLGGYAL